MTPRKPTANEQIQLEQEVLNAMGAEMARGLKKCRIDTRNDTIRELRARLKPWVNIKAIDVFELQRWLDELFLDEDEDDTDAQVVIT